MCVFIVCWFVPGRVGGLGLLWASAHQGCKGVRPLTWFTSHAGFVVIQHWCIALKSRVISDVAHWPSSGCMQSPDASNHTFHVEFSVLTAIAKHQHVIGMFTPCFVCSGRHYPLPAPIRSVLGPAVRPPRGGLRAASRAAH